MGKQIQINLSSEDELALIAHLEKNDEIQIANSEYGNSWDQRTFHRDMDAYTWLIFDRRIERDIATQLAISYRNPDGDGIVWRIHSYAGACIEWCRQYRLEQFPYNGRLYVNTNWHEIGPVVHQKIGKSVDRIYQAASRWIKKNCVNCSSYKTAIWVSKSKAQEYLDREKRILEAAKQAPRDPRDKNFYDLNKKKREKLTLSELDVLIEYYHRMIEFLKNNETNKPNWIAGEKELQERKQAILNKK